jgi:hypothetical protein
MRTSLVFFVLFGNYYGVIKYNSYIKNRLKIYIPFVGIGLRLVIFFLNVINFLSKKLVKVLCKWYLNLLNLKITIKYKR